MPNKLTRDARVACVALDSLPLQLLQRSHPEWRDLPAVVVEADRPSGRVLYANAAAYATRVLPGMRYASALALVRDLRAGVVEAEQVSSALEEVTHALRAWSPSVEVVAAQPGVFYLDATGLERLFGSLTAWSSAVYDAVTALELVARVVVGYSRWGAFVAARAYREVSVQVLETPEQEALLVRSAPLAQLDLEAKDLAALEQLGVRTVAALLRLPAEGVQTRLGPNVVALQQRARGELFDPLQPTPERRPLVQRLLCESPETDANRLLFLVKRVLEPLLNVLERRAEALASLLMVCRLDDKTSETHRVCPAVPTRDALLILDLVRLRLETMRLASGVVELRVVATGVRADVMQQTLFREGPKRDLEAANRALARVRAELGDGAVLRMVRRDGHLPEAMYGFEPMTRLEPARPRLDAQPRWIRRVLKKPRRLPGAPRVSRDEGWRPIDPAAGPVVKMHGPYVVSGGWWQREQQREYHFAQTLRGDLLWVYFDRVQRCWYLHGWVA